MVISLAKYNNFGWVRRDGECMVGGFKIIPTCRKSLTYFIKKILKIPKGKSEPVYRKITDKAMAKRKSTKGHPMLYQVHWFYKLQNGCTGIAAANDQVDQLLTFGRWFSPGAPSSTTKAGHAMQCPYVYSSHIIY
jgi:hypothetical protein